MSDRWIGLLGIAVILGIAALLSNNRRAIRPRIVAAAFALQAAMAGLVLYLPFGKVVLAKMSAFVMTVIDYSSAGIDFVFGGLNTDVVGFSIAVNVLPIVIFFSALMAVLYHLKIMQWVVRGVGGFLHWIIGTQTVESMNAAANIFVGQTEAPLAVRPYLKTLTDAQLFAVMVSGLASVAGTVLAAYVLMGAEMEHLLAASFMAAPGGLLMAKIIMPDVTTAEPAAPVTIDMNHGRQVNVILAAAVGAGDGVKLAVNIGAMLIAFVALIALVNGVVGFLGAAAGIEGLTLQRILGWAFAPVMFLLTIPWHEAQAAGALFGEKLILNEFLAFSHLHDYLAGMSERTVAIVTFSLCGFANLASIAVLLGGIGSLVPEKKELIARFGLKAVAAGSLANLMSAALAGLLL